MWRGVLAALICIMLIALAVGIFGWLWGTICAVFLGLLGLWWLAMVLEEKIGFLDLHKSTIGERLTAIEDRLSAIEARMKPPESEK